MQLRKSVEVDDDKVEVVTMKNGKKAAKAVATVDGKEVKLFKILSNDDAERLSK
ncbi:hypothetical protein ACFL2C_02440 [Patescibacteria group bacterium]